MRSVIISDTSLRIVGLFYDLSAGVNPCENATSVCTGKREFCEITPAAPYYECKECCRPKKPAEDRLSCECKCGHYLIIGHYRLEHIQHKLLIMLIVGASKSTENRFIIHINSRINHINYVSLATLYVGLFIDVDAETPTWLGSEDKIALQKFPCIIHSISLLRIP